MIRKLLLFALATSAFAAGTVQQTASRLGNTDNWVVAFQWTGDSVTGTVPATNATGIAQLQGYLITAVETTPGTPAPSAGYGLTVKDPSGFDVLAGAAASLSASVSEAFAASTAAPPLQGAFTITISGNSVASARGSVFVFLSKPGSVAAGSSRFSISGATAQAHKWVRSITPNGLATLTQPSWIDLLRTPTLLSSEYVFTQTPNVSLTGAVQATVSMAPCPLGVAGTNTYHYLYLSGGSGTAEAVLITGGTCTSGATTGTIIFTPANNHSGLWTVASATAGIQEAYWTVASGEGATIAVPAGTLNTYATITLLSGRKVALVGQGRETTILASQDATSANAIDLLGTSLSSGSNNEIRNLQVTCVAGKTQGYGIGLEYQIYSKISDSTIIGCPSGIHWGQTINQGRIINVAIREMENATGMGILMDGAASFANVVSEVVSDTSGQPLAGIRIRFTGDVVIQNSHFIHCSYGMLIDPPVLPAAVNSVEVINTYLDNNVTAGLLIQPIGEVARIRFLNSWASSGAGVGILLSLAGGGTIDGVSFEQMHVFGNGLQGMLVNGGGSISVNNSWFSSNGTSAPGTLPGIAIAANVSNWRIENNRSGPSSGFTSNTQSYGLDISAGTSTNWVVAGNDFTGNATASFRDLSTGTTKRLSGNIPFQMDDGGTIVSASTMTISPAGSFYHVSGTTNIDNINTCNASNASRTITLVFLDTLTVNDGGNLSLAGNVSATAGDSLVLVCEGTLWVELSRSNNF